MLSPDPSARPEAHSFPLQQEPLPEGPVAPAAQTDPARRVDHPVPGDRGAGGERMQGVADLPGATG